MSSSADWPAWKMLAVLVLSFGGLGLILGSFGKWDVFIWFSVGTGIFAVGIVVAFGAMKVIQYFKDGGFNLPTSDDSYMDSDGNIFDFFGGDDSDGDD